jgi:hypothetical protein
MKLNLLKKAPLFYAKGIGSHANPFYIGLDQATESPKTLNSDKFCPVFV